MAENAVNKASGESFPVPSAFARCNIDLEMYERLYKESINEPEAFWERMSREHLTWAKDWDRVYDGDFARGNVHWFLGGKLNASYNCLDRHLTGQARNKTALIWESDDPSLSRQFTYAELHRDVCRFANILKGMNVRRGDCVLIYLPMIPELPVAMLACARIGAIHSVVFGGFSPQSLVDRIDDCKPVLIVTSDGGMRGGKQTDMKKNVDAAITRAENPVRKVITIKRTGGSNFDWNEGRDHWLHDLNSHPEVTDVCKAEEMDSEDPLFILYTSGSTGKPKGVVHSTGGYLLGASMTHRYIFDSQPNDIYWCTADIGWITGHSYILYGPLANGATSVMFEGVPTYPDPGRFWDIIDKYHVTVFYTAPTVIRALSREGEQHVQKRSLSSLRLLGSVGEPINPEAWLWYWRNVGRARCPIVDTYWQTETGSIVISPLPGAHRLKPGSAGFPFFGIAPVLVDENGRRLPDEGYATGNLCFAGPWPSLMRGVHQDPQRFYATYFSDFPGYYFTGDGAIRDADGYWWITGRVDDVLNVSGHRIGSAEVESALVAHEAVAEAAVVAYPHIIKGQGIYAYVTLNQGVEPNAELEHDLVALVGTIISPIARPNVIHWAPSLPKTRSGKIMRRILRKVAEGEFDTLGDITTLAEPGVVEALIFERQQKNL